MSLYRKFLPVLEGINEKAPNIIIDILKVLTDELEDIRKEDYNYRINSMALTEIRWLGEEAVELLIELLENNDINIRKLTIKVLGYLANEQAIHPIINALFHDVAEVQEVAVKALGWLGISRVLDSFMEKLDGLDSEKREKILILIYNAFESEFHVVRSFYALLYGFIGDQRGVKLLIQALKDENERVRISAAISSGRMGIINAIELIIQAFKEKDPKDDYTLKNVFKLYGVKALEPLTKALQNNDPSIRKFAAAALGNIKNEKTIYPLIDDLKDPDLEVKLNALESIKKIADKKAIDPLIRAFKDEDGRIRKKIIEGLAHINFKIGFDHIKSIYGDLYDETWACYLINMFKHVNPILLEIKKNMLKRLKPKEMADIAVGKNVEFKNAVLEAIQIMINNEKIINIFIQALNDKNWTVREKAAKALSRLTNKKFFDLYLEMLKDSDSYIRKPAIIALGWIGDKRAVDPLIEMLKNSNWDERSIIAQALGHICDKRAFEPLLDLYLEFTKRQERGSNKQWQGILYGLHTIKDEHNLEFPIEVPEIELELWQQLDISISRF